MKKLQVPDESGITWLVTDEDPLWEPVQELGRIGVNLTTLVLPNEFPRLLECHDPDYQAVLAHWPPSSPEEKERFRVLLHIHQTRELIQHAYGGIHAKRSQGDLVTAGHAGGDP